MMRDAGFNFYWSDYYCQNLFARGFELEEITLDHLELITAFEVFEHLVVPRIDLESLLLYARNLLICTKVIPTDPPPFTEWNYYSLEEGQHISFFSERTFQVLAERYGLNYYAYGNSLHLLTEKQLPSNFFEWVMENKEVPIPKPSLLTTDYFYLTDHP